MPLMLASVLEHKIELYFSDNYVNCKFLMDSSLIAEQEIVVQVYSKSREYLLGMFQSCFIGKLQGSLTPNLLLLLCISIQSMQSRLLRLYHQTVSATHLSSEVDTQTSLLYFLISFIVLVVVAIFYVRNSVSSFIIPISPTEEQRRFILILVICIMGGIGLYAAIERLWGSHPWIYYAVFNLLLAGFIFIHQTTNSLSLIISCILMGFLAFGSYWLFHETSQNWIVHVLVGAVEAWALLWFLYVLGQVMVYECGLSRKLQNVCFFITALVVMVLQAFWHMHHHDSLGGMLGYLVAGIILLILFFSNSQRNSGFY